MPDPLLTIGIPHLNRTEHLRTAIGSCLQQTIPVKIIIADQGATDDTAKLMARYEDHPQIEHFDTSGSAHCLWDNWRAAAEACETPYFAWLQDDDRISQIFALRVTKAFGLCPDALHWQARCYVSIDNERAAWWGPNGPQVGLKMMDGGAEQWPGQLLLGSMYLLSWALSPGVAFRCGDVFSETLRELPSGCDLFQERLVLASMGLCGPFVADSVTAGYWHHHGKNESYAQNGKKGEIDKQLTIMIDYMDSLLDQAGSWQELFYMWLRTRSPQEVLGWMEKFPCKASRHLDSMMEAMSEAVKDRVQPVDHQPGQVLELEAGGSTLIFDPEDSDTMRVCA